MPLGGGALGLNVWVENNELLFYIGSPDAHVENVAALHIGKRGLKLRDFLVQLVGTFGLMIGHTTLPGGNKRTVHRTKVTCASICQQVSLAWIEHPLETGKQELFKYKETG